MKQQLAIDVLLAFGVWFVIAYFSSGFPLGFVPNTLSGLVVVWAVGIAAGCAIALAMREAGVVVAKRSMDDRTRAGDNAFASVMDADGERTLYPVAMPQPELPPMGKVTRNRLHDAAWWATYAERSPQYAVALDDIYAVLASRPDLPAGIAKHLGVSLIAHSVEVAERMLELAPALEFAGLKNRKGAVIPGTEPKKPPVLGDGTLEHVPLLPLVGLAHDVGKIECLIRNEDGAWQMLPRHGPRGSNLLRRLPSVRALPMAERDALLIAVACYHNQSEVPSAAWITDSARALTALLYEADRGSSYNAVDPTKKPATADNDNVVRPENADLAPGQVTREPPPATSDPQDEEADHDAVAARAGDDLISVLDRALLRPDAVNGKSRADRVAFKFDQWLYIEADKLAVVMASEMEDPPQVDTAAERAELLQALAGELDAHDWLYTGTREAIKPTWTATSAKISDGVVPSESRYDVIVVATAAVPFTENVNNCPYRPLLLDPDAGELGKRYALTQPGDAHETTNRDADRSMIDARALTTNEQPSAKSEITQGVLRALASSDTPLYGMHGYTSPKGNAMLVFDLEQLEAAFVVPKDPSPEGVYITKGNADGRMKVVVKAP